MQSNLDKFQFHFHVTARCINKDWFSQPMNEVWETMSNYLFFIHHSYKVSIHSFVLMVNHYHLLISSPHGNLSEAMMYFNRETSRALTRPAGRINQMYGSRFFRSSIRSPLYLKHSYKYVYQNPVRAGVCQQVEQYPYSTLHGLLGLSKLGFPVTCDDNLFMDTEGTLKWLNTPADENHISHIRSALRRPTFKLPIDRVTRKPSKLENDPL